MILAGSIVNFATIVGGSLLGLLVGKLLTEKLQKALMSAISLVVIGIALSGLFGSTKPLVPILSMVIGTFIGELLDIDRAVNRLGDLLQKKVGGQGRFTEGFVTGSLVFAVGAMAIMGGLNSGLHNDHTILYAKSVIDGFSSIIFASTMGIGVAFSAVVVFLWQGIITLLSSYIAPILNDVVVAEITYVGSLLIMGIGLNLMGLTKLRLLNMMPAMLIPVILCRFM